MTRSAISAVIREHHTARERSRDLALEIQKLQSQLARNISQLQSSAAAIRATTSAAANGFSPASRPGTPRPADANGNDGLKLLTPREIEVLRMIGDGKRTKEMAFELGIAVQTAATHRWNIMEKLGIHEGPMLVRFAIRAGLCNP